MGKIKPNKRLKKIGKSAALLCQPLNRGVGDNTMGQSPGNPMQDLSPSEQSFFRDVFLSHASSDMDPYVYIIVKALGNASLILPRFKILTELNNISINDNNIGEMLNA